MNRQPIPSQLNTLRLEGWGESWVGAGLASEAVEEETHMKRRARANEWSGGLWIGGLAAVTMALLGMAAPSSASAQWNPRARPQFGHLDLRSGFMPDPRILTGTLGGRVNANQVNGSCRGLITPNPSHIIRSRTGFRNIRFVVNADRDATLVVMLPDGRVICDDDGGEGVNPLIQTSARRGNIAVWVGAYSQSYVGASYRLGVTELNHISARNLQGGGAPPPGVQIQPVQPQIQAGNGLNPRMAPAYGQLNLRAGFMPDPAIMSGQPGGPIRGSDVSRGCRGYYSPQPNHVINTQTGFRNIRFIVNSSVDLTLAVMTPDGRITCDDDGGAGNNPLVQTNSPPGAIRVWVGTYSQSRRAPYNMGVSELGNIGTNNIPRPGQGGVVVGPGPGPVAPPQVQADVVQMTVGIPVTLMGPGMGGNTVAMWQPRGGSPTQVRLQGRALMAGTVNLAQVPPGFRDPVITVQQQRNGNLVARAEQPPQGRGDRGQVLLLEVRWQGGRPSIANRWTGTAVQRGPRWAR